MSSPSLPASSEIQEYVIYAEGFFRRGVQQWGHEIDQQLLTVHDDKSTKIARLSWLTLPETSAAAGRFVMFLLEIQIRFLYR
ncbi:MAG: hypothetical protein ACI8UO_006446 [Verrucomicrobiales bacterium]|jgi:hypothetical protein